MPTEEEIAAAAAAEGAAKPATVTLVEVESMEDILGIPGVSNVMVPEKKPNTIFSKGEKTDMSFIDNPNDDNAEGKELGPDGKPIISTAKAAAILDNITAPVTDDDDDANAGEGDDKTKGGRPKTDKSALVEFTQKWITDKKLKPFTNDEGVEEDITKYSVKDFEELFEANFNEGKTQTKKEAWTEFFNQLPPEMKALHKYVADGGTDMKTIFRALSTVEEARSLDVENPEDQEQIARQYLRATSPGLDEEDIDEQIATWKDKEELAGKVAKFKPRLDQMGQQQVAQQVQKQEQLRKQQQERAAEYMDSVFDVLDPGELNGLKLDKKTQSMLYAGLIQPNYPSLSGKNTNMLGHLLEKYQFVEPNHALIAEALWLLSNPEEYRNKVREAAKKEATEKTVRMLKTEEQNRTASGNNSNTDDDAKRTPKDQGLKRNNANFFKRG